MTSLVAVNVYICANILLLLIAGLLFGIRAFGNKLSRPIAFHHQLQCGYALTVAAVLLPLFGVALSHDTLLTNTAQVWSAPTMHDWNAQSPIPHTAIALTPLSTSVSLDVVSQIATALFLTGLLILLFRIAIDTLVLVRILANAQTIRRSGQLRIISSDRIGIPFSCWWPRSSIIVIPSTLLTRPSDFKMALRHEGQHHRQHDTRLLYLYQLLRAIFFWNPAVHYLAKSILELQEFACDEALSTQRKISVLAYSGCLLRIAESAAKQRSGLLHSNMTGGTVASVLRKRIEVMMTRPTRHLGKSMVVAVAAMALLPTIATALAFATTIRDRRISLEDANRMAAVAQQTSAFPIAVNERVLEQLNRFLGTPDGRTFVRDSLERMKAYRPLMANSIEQSGFPQELLAVPLVESGYRNLSPSNYAPHGAGLWMFIKPTARALGLTVDQGRDDRLNVAAETNAAMRYFAVLHDQFDDWGLALLAYNSGSKNVEKAIRATGSRDVWEITRQGYENDRDYLPRVMAAILIIKNPNALK